MLNDSHPNIQFRYGTEYSFKLAFLDVMVWRDGANIVTTICRIVINADVYFNSFAPHSWIIWH